MEDEEPSAGGSEVPYSPNWTPAVHGKLVGEDKTLSHHLDLAVMAKSATELKALIGDRCLSHIKKLADRGHMARFAWYGLRGYLLAEETPDGGIALTETGKRLHKLAPPKQDVEFAKHILTRANGMRFCEVILSYQLRGDTPTMEDLVEEGLDRQETSASLSVMKAWLTRAGVMKAGNAYVVIEERLNELIGEPYEAFAGATREQVEFLLSARVEALNTGTTTLAAPAVRKLTKARVPGLKIPSKGLMGFVGKLEAKGLVKALAKGKGGGGSSTQFRLKPAAVELTEEQVLGLVSQLSLGAPLSKLPPLHDVFTKLDTGHAQKLGQVGEDFATHLCLMLGLRVIGRNVRTPNAEIDILAERNVSLSYQRWAIQVKNVVEGSKVRIDRIDRELGAVAGTGATHVLFVVPRSELTPEARAELQTKSALTPLHMYVLDRKAMGKKPTAARLLQQLDIQASRIAELKAHESTRRESV